MIATKSIKETILAELKTKAIVSIPASEADYLSVAADLPFKVEYHDSEIITMGLATPKHEALVMNIGTILNILFSENENLMVYGSNVGVQIPKFEGGYYMPDALVVKGELELIAKSNCIISNPYIIVEVLSPATSKFDTSDKFDEYKTLESLKQIIFINQHKVSVASYIRTEKPNTWLHQDCRILEESITIENSEVSLATIYRKVKFER